MAKKPDLMPGEYGIKVEYWTETMRTITVWVGEVFPYIEEAEAYLYSMTQETAMKIAPVCILWIGKERLVEEVFTIKLLDF